MSRPKGLVSAALINSCAFFSIFFNFSLSLPFRAPSHLLVPGLQFTAYATMNRDLGAQSSLWGVRSRAALILERRRPDHTYRADHQTGDRPWRCGAGHQGPFLEVLAFGGAPSPASRLRHPWQRGPVRTRYFHLAGALSDACVCNVPPSSQVCFPNFFFFFFFCFLFDPLPCFSWQPMATTSPFFLLLVFGEFENLEQAPRSYFPVPL